MSADRNWIANPGTKEKPKDPNAMVWLRYRCGQESMAPRKAGGFNWKHRGWDFDIVAAAKAD